MAPLDWGLGHATRCMPLIDLMLGKGIRIVIAGNGDSFFLLKDQYPSLTFYEIPGYNISYPGGKNAAVQSLIQTPKILRTIREENKHTADIISKENIDLIISDNRYGVRNEKVKSIFICHHIALQAPKQMSFMNPLFLNFHLQQINKFNALWIPDEEGENNLSGKLSHHIDFKIPHTYIGIQSRFSDFTEQPSFIDELDFTILAALSGPEPQRTYLENQLKTLLGKTSSKILLVQGKTDKFSMNEEENITTVSYLNARSMFAALQKSRGIICRSGYSTIMDLAVLGKKAVLIPAEGQTEQEYLAYRLSKKEYAVYCTQTKLDVLNCLEKLDSIKGFPPYKSSTKKMEDELDKLLE